MFFLLACTDPADTSQADDTASSACAPGEAEGWTEASHAKGNVDAETVFPTDRVQRLDLVICPDDFTTMTADLPEAGDAPPDGGGGGGGGAGGGPPGGGGAPEAFDLEEPAFAPATLWYGDQSWPWVGVRFKGNSSLSASVAAGVEKLPLRIDMDQYEDEAPDTDDQRFFGFQKLSLGPGYSDPSYLREVLTSELFADAGMPVARAAFYELWVDVGEGATYWGLYTVVEDPENAAFLDDNFGDDDGNLFQPDGDCANWTCFAEADFGDQTGAGDFTEASAAVAALAADPTDAAAWRAELEAHLDVDSFLTWLAWSTVIGNWDSYGTMAHNYFLYAPPGTPLTWIPWDHNMAMTDDLSPLLSLSLAEVTSDWPLIRTLLDDPEYAAAYQGKLGDVAATLDLSAFNARAEALHTLISPYVAAEVAPFTQLESQAAFADSVTGADGLEAWMADREALLDAELAD